ncbi:MAG: hypothetical protein LUH54_01385, partial [Firmicutes bacterium]|nr:hypothetical protein [Bacillota bacterium]
MKSVIIPDIRAGFDYLSSLVGSETEKERRVWVIIPDQMVLTTEREFSRRLSPSSQLYYEVVSFRRLADNIFRKYGGISYSYADGCAESLLMRRAISLCRDSLLVYGESSGSASFVPVMLSAVRELKQCMISPDMLEEASLRAEAESDDADVAFSAGKYIDIANIWRVYDSLLNESYSDRTSEMTHAAALADKRSFFRDDTVVFFSFSGFTPQQLSMIRAALKCAYETVSIFITPSVPNGGVEYDLIEDTLARLYKLSRALRVDFSREVKDVPEKNGGISELSRLLWKSSGTGGDPSALSILKCESLRGMAEAAAIKISRVIREGGRYGDFVLVAGNVETARPAVEEIFGEYGIPCHLSYRVRLDTLPESSAILNALRVVTGGWRRDDIISYIKTGFAGIDRDEADELEIYLCTWNIHGRGFYEPMGGGWGMNPDGYREGFADGAAERLEALNKSRERVVSPLYELFDAFSDTTTVYTKTAAVREFMSAMGLSSDSFGEGESVRSQYVKIIEHALDSIEICTPDGVITSADFIGTLTMALDTLTAGTIPGREDEVELTTPVSLRGAGYKYVIMFGCGDGLPSDSEPEGLFTDSERMALEGAGLDTGSSVPKHSMELYNFSRAVSYASDEVMFLYMPTGAGDDDDDPDVIARIRRIYPDIKRGRFSGVRYAADVFCEGVLRRRFTFMSSGNEEKAAVELLSMSPDGRRIIKSSEIPVSLPHEKISNETARNLFGGNLSFSQSRIESFVSCKFGFYCEYVLSLKEKERA